MRTALVIILGSAPSAACSDAFVMAPPVVAAAPVSLAGTRATYDVVIRNGRALASRAIIIVDGIVVPPTDLNTANVEAIEMVKGAAAATIYGTQTRCPAIIIRTRQPTPAPLLPRVDRPAAPR